MEQRTRSPEAKARFWQSAPEYHGALANAGDYRLSISPNGKRYQVQKRATGPDGLCYIVVKWRKSLDRLRPDIPAAVASVMPSDLPDDPGEYVRPWASDISAASDRVRKAMPSGDGFAGVIANGKRARLVWLAPLKGGARGPRYALQVKDGGRWANVALSQRASYLHAVVFGRLHETHPAAAACGDRALQSAVCRLSESAVDYAGRRPESLAEVQAALGRGSVSIVETRRTPARGARMGCRGEPPQNPLQRLQPASDGPQGRLRRHSKP